MSKNNIFDGKPSVELAHRPFYSIVVPCYNPSKYIERLLNSIVNQKMSDDIEVILSDDCSTEDYQNIINKYNKRISIKQIKTDYNYGPGNAREKGCSIAEGQWLTFADQDDFFIKDSLKKIKQEIIDKNEQYHVIANFYEVQDNTYKILKEFKRTRNWCHGKFYNIDNLWKPYGVHFMKDLKTHEDIYVSSTIMCVMNTINKDNPLYSDTFCYCWVANPKSISRTEYNNMGFVEKYFNDYLTSTISVVKDSYLKGNITRRYALEKSFDVFLFCYFYIQRFKYRRPTEYDRSNIEKVSKYYKDLKNILVFSNRDIYKRISTFDDLWYNAVRESAKSGVGPFIEVDTFEEFLYLLDMDNRDSVVDWALIS